MILDLFLEGIIKITEPFVYKPTPFVSPKQIERDKRYIDDLLKKEEARKAIKEWAAQPENATKILEMMAKSQKD